MNAELSVIGSVLLDNDAFWRVDLRPSDFEIPEHAAIWRTMWKVAGEGFPIDPVTLCEQDDSLDLKFLSDLAVNTPSSKNIEGYAKLVREKSVQRRSKALLASALNGELDVPELISRLDDLAVGKTDLTLTDAVKSGIALAESSEGTGIPTGLPMLDRWLHVHGGKLVIVAARPSIGKTAFVWQWLLHAARPVGFISLEMGADELGLRALSHKYRVDSLALTRGNREAIEKVKDKTLDLPVRLDFRSTSLPQIVSRITEWKHRHKVEMVAVDYLQLIDADGENRNAELGRITRTLKKLANRLSLPIVLLCQFNRALEKTGRKPMLVDLRDSGEIEQDADIVLALHSELSEKPRRQVEFGILKNRAGRVGWPNAQIDFEGEYQTFREIEPFRGAA